MFIPNPCSNISFPNPGLPRSRIRSKEVSLIQKTDTKFSKKRSKMFSRIPDPGSGFFFHRIPALGVKKEPDPGFATLDPTEF
jgi:hypothetical protein